MEKMQMMSGGGPCSSTYWSSPVLFWIRGQMTPGREICRLTLLELRDAMLDKWEDNVMHGGIQLSLLELPYDVSDKEVENIGRVAV